MLLNLLNLYSLIFALFSKIDGMGRELNALKPTLCMNASTIPESALNMTEALALSCQEVSISCRSCNVPLTISANTTTVNVMNAIRAANAHEPHMQAHDKTVLQTEISPFTTDSIENMKRNILSPHNLIEKEEEIETTTENIIYLMRKEIEKLNQMFPSSSSSNENSSEASESDELFYDYTDANTPDSSFEFESNTVSEFSNETLLSSTLDIDPIYGTVSNENTSSSTDYSSVRSTSDSESTMSVTYTYTSPIFDFSTDNRSSVTTESTISRDTSSVITVSNPATTFQYPTNANLSTETGMYTFTDDDLTMSTRYPDVFTTELSTPSSVYICPSITFNCTISCGGQNVTQVVLITDCTKVEKRCYVRQCKLSKLKENISIDYVYEDEHKRKMYSLTTDTKKKLLKLCWETMFGQELVKLTMMDLVSLKPVRYFIVKSLSILLLIVLLIFRYLYYLVHYSWTSSGHCSYDT